MLKLAEALAIRQKNPSDGGSVFTAFLACGFQSLHLETFLGAYLQQSRPNRRVVIRTGVYGSLTANLSTASRERGDCVVAMLELSDLDSRLGVRALGGWAPDRLGDILDSARKQAAYCSQLIKNIAQNTLVAVCLPTLPIPPVSYFPGFRAAPFELELSQIASWLALDIAAYSNVRIASPQRINEVSPSSERLDVKSELAAGFPYHTAHASRIAEVLTALVQPPPPKKGLITDLDDTLWRGVLGDVGAQNVSWSLDQHSHIHALYQQMLQSLAQAGVLIAVASKNDRALVEEVLKRPDLLVSPDHLYPIECHWGSKSQSVRRILQAWNIGPDSVVMVDDSAMELDQVKADHPQIDGLLFPTYDDQAAYVLLNRLRDLFGKGTILEEDRLRVASIRQREQADRQQVEEPLSEEAFLSQLGAEIVVSPLRDSDEPRPFELVNKTNQFNLNGRRYSHEAWRTRLGCEGNRSFVVDYHDKYGRLGRIAVILAQRQGRRITVEAWVMSCRAFNRRIEHKCLEYLFASGGVEEIRFDFLPTDRNTPLRQFFAGLVGEEPRAPFVLDQRTFEARKPLLHQKMREG